MVWSDVGIVVLIWWAMMSIAMFHVTNPFVRWAARILPALVVRAMSWVVAPFAVLQMVLTGNRETAPAWARWAAPFDHHFCGPKIDGMWQAYWDGTHKSPAWYVKPLRAIGITDPSHPVAMLLQFWRNGAGTANYLWFGVWIGSGKFVTGSDGNYDEVISGVHRSFRRTYRWLGGETWIGWKIDAPKDGFEEDDDPRSGYAKWIFYPWRE